MPSRPDGLPPRHRVVFHPAGRTATQKPDPAFPDGLVMDLSAGAERRCAVDLAHPSDGIGMWEVRCRACGIAVAATAAGRTDDPRRIVLACGRDPRSLPPVRRPWRADVDGGTPPRD